MSEHFETTCDLLVAEVSELSPGALVRCSREHPISFDGEFVVGSIGFCGRTIRGSITLAALPEVWERFAPGDLAELVLEKPAAIAMLCDMVGELANLLLGRFRNALLRAGVEISSATPTAVLGRIGQVQCLRAKQSAWHAFRTDAGDVYVRLDASFEPGFSLPGPVRIEPHVDELTLF